MTISFFYKYIIRFIVNYSRIVVNIYRTRFGLFCYRYTDILFNYIYRINQEPMKCNTWICISCNAECMVDVFIPWIFIFYSYLFLYNREKYILITMEETMNLEILYMNMCKYMDSPKNILYILKYNNVYVYRILYFDSSLPLPIDDTIHIHTNNSIVKYDILGRMIPFHNNYNPVLSNVRFLSIELTLSSSSFQDCTKPLELMTHHNAWVVGNHIWSIEYIQRFLEYRWGVKYILTHDYILTIMDDKYTTITLTKNQYIFVGKD